ncbi:UTRA domain-containing protein [Streptomyces spiramyceticus]|uniref:UTRA domain-containing protein n=1 Tax=Streptomyces spiramyceticus TaxID=299717 RepID=UPI00237B60F3|nr:UTRA domain-containing protein [Streptomyces spiramyceticus]
MQASLLGISEGAPVLSLERVTRDQHGRLFEYTWAIYRGDRYRLVSHLTLDGPPDEVTPRVTPTL